MRAVLKFQNTTHEDEIFLVKGQTIVLGRGEGVDHKLLDNKVSANHCKLSFRDNKIEIHDLNSKNGTYLNGIRIEKSDLFVGDVIKLGKTTLSFNPEEMSPQTLRLITFSGSTKQRIAHELRPDYTRIGIKKNYGPEELNTILSMKKEVSTRRGAVSSILLTKSQVKKQNALRSSLASTLDLLIFMAIVAFPLLMVNLLYLFEMDFLSDHRAMKILLIEIMILGAYAHLNFNLLKFSLGEKLTGIERIYKEQS